MSALDQEQLVRIRVATQILLDLKRLLIGSGGEEPEDGQRGSIFSLHENIFEILD